MHQYWDKLGLIYDGKTNPDYSYASVPVLLFLNRHTARIYFSSRDYHNRSFPFYLDYDLRYKKILDILPEPLLVPGDWGAFDDSGIMPTCVVKYNTEIRLYYIGWNLGITVPFRNSLGLAVSYDNGSNFKKAFKGPVLDRNKHEPHFNASACIINEGDIWKIWYLSCIKWEKNNDGIKHYYHIKYAESPNGIDWVRNGRVAIDFKYPNEYAISVPRVIQENGLYKMWYSYRGGSISEKYRIGYAESENGIDWIRKDENMNLPVSESGWDSDMICYPCIFDYEGDKYMLYNGNGYGKTGFGLAVLKK